MIGDAPAFRGHMDSSVSALDSTAHAIRSSAFVDFADASLNSLRHFWRASAIALAMFFHLVAASSVQQEALNVLMTGNEIVGPDRIYDGVLTAVPRGRLLEIFIPQILKEEYFTVFFMKPGFARAEFCRNDDAAIYIRQGQSTTPEQLRALFGNESPSLTQPFNLIACTWSLSFPYTRIPSFEVVIKYEEEIPPNPAEPAPPTKDVRFVRPDAYSREYHIFCQQLSHNRGCSMTFACPQGSVLTRAGALCNLETGLSDGTSPTWGRVDVRQPSGRVADGNCGFGRLNLRRYGADFEGLEDFTKGEFPVLSCKEHDENGGDCSVEAAFTCNEVEPETKTFTEFGCSKSNSNEGCSTSQACPAGYVASDARASCNLETATKPPLMGYGMVTVTRVSDNESSGKCWLGGTSVSVGAKPVSVAGRKEVHGGCAEHDANGGDCHFNAQLICQRLKSRGIIGRDPNPSTRPRGR